MLILYFLKFSDLLDDTANCVFEVCRLSTKKQYLNMNEQSCNYYYYYIITAIITVLLLLL